MIRLVRPKTVKRLFGITEDRQPSGRDANQGAPAETGKGKIDSVPGAMMNATLSCACALSVASLRAGSSCDWRMQAVCGFRRWATGRAAE
jgi:hypothetical protein